MIRKLLLVASFTGSIFVQHHSDVYHLLLGWCEDPGSLRQSIIDPIQMFHVWKKRLQNT